MTGVELIAAERQRQIDVEGFTLEHDATHSHHEISDAACCYAHNGGSPDSDDVEDLWPWAPQWWKPSTDPVRNLVKAGALIAAEIDRQQAKGKPAT